MKYQRAGMNEEVKQAYQQATKHDPHYIEASGNLGTVCPILGLVGEAEAFWYTYETNHKMGAGFTVSNGCLSFKIEALAIEESCETWEAAYYYKDQNTLDFWINSDHDWSQSEPDALDGVGIWFSE
ncbi:MAG: hypothetical protein R6V83_00565 [Candidatus Thorarchaeota archaeon]